MSSPAADQLRRILHVIPHLADGEEHSLDEIASLVGIDRSRLVADLTSVSERFDEPAGWVDGVSISIDPDSVCVVTNHFLRPMRLTMSELCALELGLGLLRRERTPAEAGAIDRALARLRAVISKLPSNERHEGLRVAELSDGGNAAHLATVRGAVRERRKIRLRYRSGSRSESTTRTICPYSLLHTSGSWYVVAHCDRSAGMRFFRMDRVEAAERLEEPFALPHDFDVARVAEGDRPFAAPGAATMTIRYSPRVAPWIVEREGGEGAADGSLTRDYPLADAGWGVRHALQYGPDAEVLAPPALREEIVRRLEGMGGRPDSSLL